MNEFGVRERIGSHCFLLPNVIILQAEQGRQCTYKVTLRRVRVTAVDVEEQQLLHILGVCLQPFLSSVQCACAILSYVACPALQYFSTLSH